jgi:hypothetical protein
MKQDDSTTNSIISWMASPKDPALKRQAMQLVDELLDDPGQLFEVGALALIREKMLGLPLLLELHKKAYAELLSPTRLAEASTTDIVNICKFANKELHSTITLAQGARYAQKPSMEERRTIKPVNRHEELTHLFSAQKKGD